MQQQQQQQQCLVTILLTLLVGLADSRSDPRLLPPPGPRPRYRLLLQHGGDILAPGKSLQDKCLSCFCDEKSVLACATMMCAPPSCAGHHVPEGACCPVCPVGNSCRLDSGEVIPAGQRVRRKGKVCRCRPDAKGTGLVASCRKKASRENTKRKDKKTQKTKKEPKGPQNTKAKTSPRRESGVDVPPRP